MGGVTLLQQARQAGLNVEARGGKLRVTGPRHLESLARALLARKQEIMSLLDESNPDLRLTPADLSPDWRIEWEERAAIREYDGGQAREHAEAEALREIIDRMWAAGHPI